MRLVQIKELAPHMRPARRFLNRPVGAQHIKAAIGIGLQNALERLQMRLRMFTASIRRVSKPNGRGRLLTRRLIIPLIRPPTIGLCLSVARRKYRHRGVISVLLIVREHVFLKRRDQWSQQQC